jgi:hypothetical protein
MSSIRPRIRGEVEKALDNIQTSDTFYISPLTWHLIDKFPNKRKFANDKKVLYHRIAIR